MCCGPNKAQPPKIIRDIVAFRPGHGKAMGIAAVAIMVGLIAAMPFYSNMRQYNLFTPLLIILIAASAAVILWLLIVKVSTRKKLRVIEVSEAGLAGTTFGGKRIDIDWQEVSKAVIYMTYKNPRPFCIEVQAPAKLLKIEDLFPRFGMILHVILNMCKEKGIECVEI